MEANTQKDEEHDILRQKQHPGAQGMSHAPGAC